MSLNVSYYNSVLGESSTSFINIFRNTWNHHIKTFPKKYSVGEQFVIGERFRPIILCWGYLLAGNELGTEKKKELSELALYIELLHKATLLIDDLIDDDFSRHGKRAFHIQYSRDEAILFSIFLIGDSLQKLLNSLMQVHFDEKSNSIIKLFSQTIKDMAYGALKEVNLKSDHFTSVKMIKAIIEKQTISIINNGLLTGYKFGQGNQNLLEVIERIGHDCGYIFQLLNDLEPFGSTTININHKGRNNVDVLSSRKNLIIAFIYNSLKTQDKRAFQDLILDNMQDKIIIVTKILAYFSDNNVIDSILSNLKDVRLNINRNMLILDKEIKNASLFVDFKTFLIYIFQKAIERVGPSYRTRLSDILIT